MENELYAYGFRDYNRDLVILQERKHLHERTRGELFTRLEKFKIAVSKDKNTISRYGYRRTGEKNPEFINLQPLIDSKIISLDRILDLDK